MKGLPSLSKPSLERLKTLDELPGLPIQLQEAKRLCTHTARADMICKWLLEKVRSTSEARVNSETWKTLQSTFRLLSPERIALLLASHDLPGICQTSLKESNSLETLLPAIKDVFDFLIESSTGSRGTPIKAVLSIHSTQAATFLGTWLRSVYDVLISWQTESADDVCHILLRPGIVIWNMRKHSAKENEEFATHCLAPATAMLSVLSHGKILRPAKRKRTDEQPSSHHFRQDLESMIAKHVFLPSRTAFFKARELAENQGRRQTRSPAPTDPLTLVYELLGVRLGVEPLGDSDALPRLLDIALRCAPVTTPKQRIAERPWIEAVFDTLIECAKRANGEIVDRSVIVKMLSVAGQRASLSKDMLEKLVRQHARLDGTTGEVNWALIAQVIEMDSYVFVGREKANMLFSAVTSATTEAAELNHEIGTKLQTLLRERVVVPTLKAFARSRDLVTFVQLWERQLQNDRHNHIWSVWTQLADAFEPLLEDSMTLDQIMDLCDPFFSSIKAATNLLSLDEEVMPQSHLDANLVILDALLAGVRSETLANRLQQQVEDLTMAMFRLCDEQVGHAGPQQLTATNERQTWALLTKAFELWFPAWAIQNSDLDTIAEKGVSLVRSHAVRTALSMAKKVRELKVPSTHLLRLACDAETFVASLCAHFYKYKQCWTEDCWVACAETTDELVAQLNVADVQCILRYPDLLAVAEAGGLNDILVNCIGTATDADEPVHASALALETLYAIAATAVQYTQMDVVKTLVEVCLRHIDENEKPEGGGSIPRDEEPLAIKVLSALPVGSLSRLHREKIINVVSRVQTCPAASHEPALQMNRFALMLKMLELPNATSVLATEPDELWNLAHSIKSSNDSMLHDIDKGRHADENASTLAFLEQVGQLVLGHLLATQDQERSRAMLVSYSTKVTEYIHVMCDRGHFDGFKNILTLIKQMICQLEADSKSSLKSQLVHRNSNTVEKFVKMSVELIINVISEAHNEITDLAETSWLLPVLKLLLAIPPSLLEYSVVNMNMLLEPLVQSTLLCLAKCSKYNRTETMSARFQATQKMMLFSYALGCKYAEGDIVARFAVLATQCSALQLQPVEHEIFLKSFGSCVDKLSPEQNIGTLEPLLERLDSNSLLSLSLAEVCATKLVETRALPTTGFSSSKVLPKFLAMAFKSKDLVIKKKAISCAVAILKGKPKLINQYSVEITLASMRKLLQEPPTASLLYLDICQVMSTLLLQYRSRLQGRFHLAIEVLQDLILGLFRSTRPPSSKQAQSRASGVKHAQALARLLTLFCEPPQMRRQSKTTELVDQSRKEQAHVGQFVQYVLHHYCAQVLSGTLADGMREALMPGLWSIIEAIEMNDAEGVKSLSAAMNNSERAVLRGVYDDWRRFGKWRGG